MQASQTAILLIEDDRALAADLAAAMAQRGWSVTTALDLEAARSAMRLDGFALILLDLALPDGNGLDFLARLRVEHAGEHPPVIVISARDDLPTRLAGLGGGADDYLIKPFQIDELDARMRIALRRSGTSRANPLLIENLAIDVAARIVTVDGEPAGFTARETLLLDLLVREFGAVVARRAVIEAVFGERAATDAAIEVLVHRLRRRLVESRARVVLHTVKGIGYMLARP